MLANLIKVMTSGRLIEAAKIIGKMNPDEFINKTNPNVVPPGGYQYGDPNAGKNAFYIAVELGQNEIAKLILNKNPALINSGRQGHEPYNGAALLPAANAGNVDLLKLLLSQMSSKLIIDNGYNALMTALNAKEEKALELLLADQNIIKAVNKSNDKGVISILEENGYYKLNGIISPEILISIINPKDKAADPKCVESLYKALFAYDVDINFHPEVAENYYKKGNILYAIGKKDDALKCYDQAINIDSTFLPKIESNIQELLKGYEQGNQKLIKFSEYLNRLHNSGNDELESKEEEPNIQLPAELVKQKGKVFLTFIEKMKGKLSQIFKDVEELEENYHSLMENFTYEEVNEGQGSSILITDQSSSIEISGNTKALSGFSD